MAAPRVALALTMVASGEDVERTGGAAMARSKCARQEEEDGSGGAGTSTEHSNPGSQFISVYPAR